MPVGEGRVSMGLHGSNREGHNQLNARSLGYQAPMGGGNFNANITSPVHGSPSANVNWTKQFADGGDVHMAAGGSSRRKADVTEALTEGLAPLLYGGAKGAVSSLGGTLGELETLGRSGLNLAGANISEEPFAPNTKRVAEFLPKYRGSKVANEVAEMGTDLGENVVGTMLDPMSLVKGAKRAAGALSMLKGSSALPSAAQAQRGVLRMPGGNDNAWKLETAHIGLPTPNIVVPGKLNNVREAVRSMKGNYGARRVERAADEIPNLEKMFQEDALKEAFTGDNASAMMTINPADFEKYATELSKRSTIGPEMEKLAKQGDIDKYTVPTDEYIKHLQRLKEGFADVPYLNLFKDEVGLPTMPRVSGHEGRHRNRSLAGKGEESALVQINPRGDLREGMPRRTQEDFIEALKEELERSGQLVVPESEPWFARPPVKLPDIYAKGGVACKCDLNTQYKRLKKGGTCGCAKLAKGGITGDDLIIEERPL